MASYAELRSLYSNGALNNKIQMALTVGIDTLLSGTPTTDDQVWADYATQSVVGVSKQLVQIVLAKNKASDLATIQTAIDTTGGDAVFQGNVDAVIPDLVIAYANRNIVAP